MNTTKSNIDLQGIQNHIKDINSIEDPIKEIEKSNQILRKIMSKDIKTTNSILKHNSNPIIFPNTINFIQGQAGVHKSRLAEIICSALLKNESCTNEFLGFEKDSLNKQYKIVYIDTERNIREQFPLALQRIKLSAGYSLKSDPNKLKYASLMKFDRSKRFKILQRYINFLKTQSSSPLFIVLDVITDCVNDFNNPQNCLQLIDLMNKTINEHDVCFLCLIHENPGKSKARGHIGTELMNKASTVLRIGFVDEGKSQNNIIQIEYLKCRATKKFKPFYAVYCENSRTLINAEENAISEAKNSRIRKGSMDEFHKILVEELGSKNKLSRQDLISTIKDQLNLSDKTIETRLKEIYDAKQEIKIDNHAFNLERTRMNRELHYSLIKK